MINRNLITSLFLILALAVAAYGQDNTDTSLQKALKEVYAGKFLIGALLPSHTFVSLDRIIDQQCATSYTAQLSLK